MSRTSTIFTVALALTLSGSVFVSSAQERRRTKNETDHLNDKNNRSRERIPFHEHDRRGREDRGRGERGIEGRHAARQHESHQRHNYGKREMRHEVYHHKRHAHHRPILVQRPRYVFYHDHNVYYDRHRNVYITYTGRSWSITHEIPFALRRIDTRRAKRIEVNYWDDDFTSYLDRGRISYGRECSDW